MSPAFIIDAIKDSQLFSDAETTEKKIRQVMMSFWSAHIPPVEILRSKPYPNNTICPASASLTAFFRTFAGTLVATGTSFTLSAG